jgi:arabinofuranan 3-O-arabinosyltransferase
MTAHVSGHAVASPGPELEKLLEQLNPQPSYVVHVTASSWLGTLPRFRPENLVDAGQLPWIASTDDKHPSIKLTWNHTQEVDGVTLDLTPHASRPTKISVKDATGRSFTVNVPKKGGEILFSPIYTDSLTIKILAVAPVVGLSPSQDVELTLPVGLQAVGVANVFQEKAPNPDQTFTLACGLGPQVIVDGTSVPTKISGTVADLLNFHSLAFTACTPSGGLELNGGSHSFSAPASAAPFSVTSVTLQHGQTPPPSSTAARTVKIENWGLQSRTIAVGAGPATYVVVSQNFNAGWVAKMGSRTLSPVRIDGWQQGYVVPAGAKGTITLDLTPSTAYRGLLILGGVLLLGLAALALLPSRRRRSLDPSGPRAMPPSWLLLVASVAVLALVGGPLCLVAIPLIWGARRWGRVALMATAFVAFAVAGIAAAWTPATLHGVGAGALAGPAQVASVIALAAVLVALVVGENRSGKRERSRPQSDLVADGPDAPED